MRSLVALLGMLGLLLACVSPAQSLKLGMWGGYIQYDSVQVPLMFELLPSGNDVPEIVFINGQERRHVTNAVIRNDSLIIPVDPFDVTIRVSFEAMSMVGTYEKGYRESSYPFKASFSRNRFVKRHTRENTQLKTPWLMTFSPNTAFMSKGVGLFQQSGAKVTGSVLTTTSDYRYFEGIIDGDSLKLSSFDGAHAFLILGKKISSGTWRGVMFFDNNYSELWEAKYEQSASLPDAFEMVKVELGMEKPYYDLLGAGSGRNAIDPQKYEGKVLIIQLFGTWCPNSHDQTKYLVNWYHKNSDKDIAILASSYEANYSQAYGLERLEAYKKTNAIPYDMVLGGRLSKRAAATPFPFIDKIEAFPTLIILDKKGYVRYVCSYFNGPATGSHYQDFDRRFNRIIEELLSE